MRFLLVDLSIEWSRPVVIVHKSLPKGGVSRYQSLADESRFGSHRSIQDICRVEIIPIQFPEDELFIECQPPKNVMLPTFLFDLTYYAMVLMVISILTGAVLVGLKARAKFFINLMDRRRAVGTSFASLGALITLIGTATFLSLYRDGAIGGYLYQQAQFSTAYLGFVFFLHGIDQGLFSSLQDNEIRRRIRITVWGAFILTVVISSIFLFNPTTYTVTQVGSQEHVAQEVVFWLPLFFTLLIGALTSFLFSWIQRGKHAISYPLWFGLCSIMVFFGTLKESNVIPTSGDNLIDLLLAFVPFIAGSFCILMSAFSLFFQSQKSSNALKYRETCKNIAPIPRHSDK
ncbi:MAG TPA: hypothetical protein VN739_08200 [Nitrososphaerales archaeon]|nr:hypothetical protein [Nitrososphaerales archaeon]